MKSSKFFFPFLFQVDYNSKIRNRGPGHSADSGGIVAIVSPLPVLKEIKTPTSPRGSVASSSDSERTSQPAMTTFSTNEKHSKKHLTGTPMKLKLNKSHNLPSQPAVIKTNSSAEEDPSLFYNVRTSL